ncbi:hypothetical protein Pmani_038079 [Petrolisthes manimaculis]|uniref:Uncharacterized protein n=1 Tax=Petrolisthes manimaculis TaxID=1843537 RepID=A0AAE1TKV4_9EUCA|nr:hypothetical protein Pmani_038079 [Petrolisthes manimaculis]
MMWSTRLELQRVSASRGGLQRRDFSDAVYAACSLSIYRGYSSPNRASTLTLYHQGSWTLRCPGRCPPTSSPCPAPRPLNTTYDAPHPCPSDPLFPTTQPPSPAPPPAASGSLLLGGRTSPVRQVFTVSLPRLSTQDPPLVVPGPSPSPEVPRWVSEVVCLSAPPLTPAITTPHLPSPHHTCRHHTTPAVTPRTHT